MPSRQCWHFGAIGAHRVGPQQLSFAGVKVVRQIPVKALLSGFSQGRRDRIAKRCTAGISCAAEKNDGTSHKKLNPSKIPLPARNHQSNKQNDVENPCCNAFVFS
jgi:hypothetical protein